MFYTCNYNIRVTHRNGAIKHNILHESDPRRDHQQIVLYSFCRSMHLLFILAVRIFFDLLYEDLSTLIYIHLSVVFPPECQQDRTLLRNQYCLVKTFLMYDLKSSTKHKEVRPDWATKNDNANYAPSNITWKVFTNGSGCHFKEIFSQG